MDYLCIVPRIPIDDKVEIVQSLTQGGGPAATAVVASARLGAKAVFCGTVGDDERGVQIVGELKSEGVDTSGVMVRRHAESPAGFSWIDCKSGKRSIAWSRGDAAPLALDEMPPDLLDGVDILHLDGHQTEVAIAAAKRARDCGVLVSLDAGTILPGIDELLELADIVIASEHFAAAYTGDVSMSDSVKKLFFGPRKFTGVTTGRNGSVGFDGDKLLKCPPHQVKEVVDTTGAGDVYHGAFAVAVASGMSWFDCMRFATVAAAFKCTALGGRTAIPNFETVENLMNKSC